MSYLDEQRKQMQTQSGSSRLGPLGFLAVLAGAVIAGFFGASYFLDQPGIAGRVRDALLGTFETAATTQNIHIPNSGKRIGRAEAAQVYYKCAQTVDFIKDQDKNVEIDPRIVNVLLQFGNQPEPYVSMTAPLLLCALEHNTSAVCDADNRAMVVDGVNKFLRMAAAALAVQYDQNARPTRRRELTDGQINSLRDQVLNAVERQVREGRLIKSDFGWFAHAEIEKVFAANKPSRDACAIK
jgi:hypothetical protein